MKDHKDNPWLKDYDLTSQFDPQAHDSIVKLQALLAKTAQEVPGENLEEAFRQALTEKIQREKLYESLESSRKTGQGRLQKIASPPRAPKLTPQLHKPPGRTLRSIATFLLSPQAYEETAKQAIVDMEWEFCMAMNAERRIKAVWILARGHIHVVVVLIALATHSVVDPIRKAMKSASSFIDSGPPGDKNNKNEDSSD